MSSAARRQPLHQHGDGLPSAWRCHAQLAQDHAQRALVARPPRPGRPAPEHQASRSHEPGLRLRGRVQNPRPRRRRQGPPRPDDRLAELVARGLRPLRPVLHPHGMAQRRHVPHPRWPRRRRHGHSTFCTAQQLAGQCQPRQGSPPVVAHQAEVRQEDLLGRSHDPYRQCRARLDGSQNLRLRRRPR